MDVSSADVRRPPLAYDSLPGPRTPSILQLRKWVFNQHSYWNEQAATHGAVYRARFPFMFGRMVVFTTPTAARTILRLKPSVAQAGRAYRVLEQSAGPSAVILLDGDEHLRMRKLILPPLHGERLARWEGFCEQRTRQEIARWTVGETIALRSVAEHLSMSVILKIVFGIRDPARSEELRGLLPTLFDIPLGATPGYFHRLGRLDLGPWSPWGAFRRRRDRIDALILAEVAERRAEFARDGQDEGDEAHADLLSMLLASRDDARRPMTDRELRDQLVTMLAAGHETTSTSIAWAIERLVRHPDLIRDLRTELDRGESDLLDAVIKETLRSRPVVPQIVRYLTEPTVIDDVLVPADTMVMLPISVIHMDPDVYPDPEAFLPQRYLDGKDPGGYSWLPFGGGTRRCPGASLALLEMRVIIRTIIQNADLAPDRPEPERPIVRGISTVPSRGASVLVRGLRKDPGPRA
ncbi:MAG: cytochrome [Solirubrobacterales bacterium]|nr:cytochrome [Solirubrobacterales bacterium]